MPTDKDYKRELERFFGYEIVFDLFLDRRMDYVCLCLIKNDIRYRIYKHNWHYILVKRIEKSKYKRAFECLVGEHPHCAFTSGVKFKTNKTVPSSYEELCILNDLMGN